MVDFEQDRERCHENYTCKVVNCYLGEGYDSRIRPFTKCVPMKSLKSYKFSKVQKIEKTRMELILMSFNIGGSINGRRFDKKTIAPLSNPNSWAKHKNCSDTRYAFGDYCTNILKFEVGETAHLLLISGEMFTLLDPAHTFHLHGYKMKLVAEGFGKIDPNTKMTVGESPDLNYTLTDSIYGFPIAIGATFQDNFQPTLIKNGIAKDTWLVPSGGWKLVEVTFDNPGLFLLHCHMTTHALEGLTIMIQVGDRINFPLPKDEFPTCHNYVPGVELDDFNDFLGYRENFPRQDLDTQNVEKYAKKLIKTLENRFDLA